MKLCTVGLDLGQAQDWTALVVVESEAATSRHTITELAGGHGLPTDTEVEVIGPPFTHRIRHLERPPLGTPYPKVVERTAALLAGLPGAVLAVDGTGVGRPVVDLLEQAGLRPVAITITGGAAVGGEGNRLRVPKRDLIAALQVAFQAERLKIARALLLAEAFVEKLLNFKVKITDSAHDTYGAWREGANDDLVLAAALAVWTAERIFAEEREAQLEDLAVRELRYRMGMQRVTIGPRYR